MELDIIAYHPHKNHLVHIEPSIDGHSWSKREERFHKKFSAASKYIFTDIFTWLEPSTPIEQIAVLVVRPSHREFLANAKIVSIDEMIQEIRNKIIPLGKASKNAIPEQYPLLRTIQINENGYNKPLR